MGKEKRREKGRERRKEKEGRGGEGAGVRAHVRQTSRTRASFTRSSLPAAAQQRSSLFTIVREKEREMEGEGGVRE